MINITENAKDTYMWSVMYHDGTTIPEFDIDRPDGRGFAEIDSTRVKTVGLSNVHNVDVPDGAAPVFFRRRYTAVNPSSDMGSYLGSVHCIGWKHGETGSYLFVFEDGSTLLTSNFQAV